MKLGNDIYAINPAQETKKFIGFNYAQNMHRETSAYSFRTTSFSFDSRG